MTPHPSDPGFLGITRRRFLQTAAVSSPAIVGFANLPAQEPAKRPAGHQPLESQSAFPLVNVAAATDAITRKSEASMVSLRDGSVLLAYAAHAGRSDNDRAPLVALKLDSQGRPVTEERVVVPPPPDGFNAMSPALQRLPDGRIGMLFSYRQSQKIASRRFTTSSDEGETWSPHVIVADGQY